MANSLLACGAGDDPADTDIAPSLEAGADIARDARSAGASDARPLDAGDARARDSRDARSADAARGAPVDASDPQAADVHGDMDVDADTDANAHVTADADEKATDVSTTMRVTFYGWDDNSPPGNAIAYPVIHARAGGVGTFEDPLTLATDQAELAIGTLVYLPFCEKYAIVEDDCVECDADWSRGMKRHIDVWMNSDGTEKAGALTSCEDAWTQAATTVEVSPPPGRTVKAAALFVPRANTCLAAP